MKKNCPSQFELPNQVETRTALYLPIRMKLCLPLSSLVRMKLGPPLNSTVLILGVSVFPKFVQWRKIYLEFVLKLTLRRRKEEVKVVSVGEFPLCFSVTPGTLCIAWFLSLFREIHRTLLKTLTEKQNHSICGINTFMWVFLISKKFFVQTRNMSKNTMQSLSTFVHIEYVP